MKTLALLTLAAGLVAAADFSKDIRPLLEQNCTACHGTARQLGRVRLDTSSGFASAGPAKVLAAVESGRMPPVDKLSIDQVSSLRDWIESGAAWPSGVVIASGGGSASGADNLALVQRIYSRIASAPPSEMKPYRRIIPGTSVSFDMAPIPDGEFSMGAPASEPGRRKDEGPVRRVRVQPFWMSAHEVTWDEYRLFMFAQQSGESGVRDAQVDAVSRPTRPYVEMSFGMGIDGYPAISMTQHAANKYAEWLSAKTGEFYRLPSEAEWEYACRAGSQSAYPWGDDASKLPEYAWFADNSDGKYQKVGTKKPNAWGLFDMLGNVMEWTLDQYAPYAAEAGVVNDPWVKSTKPYPQAVRGGAWTDDAEKCRCGSRVASSSAWKQQDPQLPKSIWYHTDAQGLGFRLVRPLKTPTPQQMFDYWNNGVEHD